MLVNTSVSAHYKIEKQIGTVVGHCKSHLYYKLLTPTITEGWRQISLQVSHPVPHDQISTCSVVSETHHHVTCHSCVLYSIVGHDVWGLYVELKVCHESGGTRL